MIRKLHHLPLLMSRSLQSLKRIASFMLLLTLLLTLKTSTALAVPYSMESGSWENGYVGAISLAPPMIHILEYREDYTLYVDLDDLIGYSTIDFSAKLNFTRDIDTADILFIGKNTLKFVWYYPVIVTPKKIKSTSGGHRCYFQNFIPGKMTQHVVTNQNTALSEFEIYPPSTNKNIGDIKTWGYNGFYCRLSKQGDSPSSFYHDNLIPSIPLYDTILSAEWNATLIAAHCCNTNVKLA